MKLEQAYFTQIFYNRESSKSYTSYDSEKCLSGLIQTGDVQEVKMWLKSNPDRKVGNMSHNPFHKYLYATILCIGMAARAAIEGGMSQESAFTLSDLYIQKADSCTNSR